MATTEMGESMAFASQGRFEDGAGSSVSMAAVVLLGPEPLDPKCVTGEGTAEAPSI